MAKQMNIYLIKQNENDDYDTYDSAVVVAANAKEARTMHPEKGQIYPNWPIIRGVSSCDAFSTEWTTWASDPKEVTVRFIGRTKRKTCSVICSSFNAG